MVDQSLEQLLYLKVTGFKNEIDALHIRFANGMLLHASLCKEKAYDDKETYLRVNVEDPNDGWIEKSFVK